MKNVFSKMKKILLILILSFIAKLNYAQSDSSKQSSLSGVIQYTAGGFWHKGKYSIDGKQITRNELFSALMNYPPSAKEFNEYKKYNTLTYCACGAALSCLITSLIANGNSSTFKNTTSKVFLGLGCGFIIPEAIFAGKRNKHYRQSLKLYNQQF